MLKTRQYLSDTMGTGEVGEESLPLRLGERRMNADRREITLLEQGIELSRSRDRLDEDADLRRWHVSQGKPMQQSDMPG